MGILNWNDKELDIRGSRIEINTKLTSKQGELWKYLTQDSSNVLLIDDGTLQYTSFAYLHGKNDIMSGFLKDNIISSIACTSLSLCDFQTISPEVIPSDIYCSEFYTDKCGSLKDLNIYINGDIRGEQRGKSLDHHANFSYYSDEISFENVSIEFSNVRQPTIFLRAPESDGFTDMSGLKSNVQILKQYTLRDFPAEYMKLFKPGNCHIYDNQKKTDIWMPVKNLKKAVAIANNAKRYKLLSHILELAPHAKVSDLYPTNILKDLDTIIIGNNNVALLLVKEGSANARPWSMSRTPEDVSRDLDKMYQKTADGWYVIWKQQN